MEITTLDRNLVQLDVLDLYESLIWTERYSKAGDFEIAAPPISNILNKLNGVEYLALDESDRLMVFDSMNIHTDVEAGNKIIVKGPSLESILNRRIVWEQTILQGNFQQAMWRLITDNAINPTNPARMISRLDFAYSDDPIFTTLEVDAQLFGNNLYDAVTDLCTSKGVGFKITVLDNGMFQFKLYAGTDRSYSQIANPYVVFSPKSENLINADYNQSTSSLKNTTLVVGEIGVGNGRRAIEVGVPGGMYSDIDRREIFTDASGVTRAVQNADPLTDDEYDAQLRQKGLETLFNNQEIKTFEGQVDATYLYTLDKDYLMGDIVQVEDSYGHEARSRVTEVIRCLDNSGTKTYPTFSPI
jgi:hypothetical protein